VFNCVLRRGGGVDAAEKPQCIRVKPVTTSRGKYRHVDFLVYRNKFLVTFLKT
jgi:hypothetical protein